jgi:SlyX protein
LPLWGIACRLAGEEPGHGGSAARVIGSNGGMHADDTDHRLTELEIKLSFTEDLVEHLNRQVAAQQALIDQLMGAVRSLREQAPAEGGPAFRSLRDELPPHY